MKKLLPYLSIAFSGFFIYIFDRMWGDSINWEKYQEIPFTRFFNYKFSIFQILIFTILTVLIYLIVVRIFSSQSKLNRNKKKLRKFNAQKDPHKNILFKYNVFFDYHDNPKIIDLSMYCLNHPGAPIKFIGSNCPNSNCKNSNINADIYVAENYIESEVVYEWDKMK